MLKGPQRDEKCRGTLLTCANQGIAFIPPPVETLGGWNQMIKDTIRGNGYAKARSSSNN